MKPSGDEPRDATADAIATRVARRPRSARRPVEAERDEGEVARGEQHRQRQRGDVALVRACRAAEAQQVRGEERRGDQREVDDDLDEAAPVDVERLQQPGGSSGGGAPLDVGEEARELHEQRRT